MTARNEDALRRKMRRGWSGSFAFWRKKYTGFRIEIPGMSGRLPSASWIPAWEASVCCEN